MTPGNNRDRLEGFLDIRWGEPADSVIAKMLAKPGVRFDSTDGFRFLFSGGEFAGFDVSEWDLRVGYKGFFSADVFFNHASESNLRRCYEDIRQRFESRFGMGRALAKGRVTSWSFYANDSSYNSLSVSFITAERVRVGFYGKEVSPMVKLPQEEFE